MRKFLVFYIAFIIIGAAYAGEPSLQKLWQTDAVLKVPESVLYDAGRKILFVSNIDGKEPWGKDGVGSIAKVGLDGKVIAAEWVKGLHAPKGLGINGNHLYVTDVDAVVTIDIEKGKIVDRLDIPGAENINDLSVGEDGTIYITDSRLGKVHKVINGKITPVTEGLTKLNGVLHSQGELFVLADGSLLLVNDKGKAEKIADGMEGNVDGVERIDRDSWLVSCWKGTVYHVTRSGKVTLLLDGRPDEISAADLGYDPVNKIAYFPGFWKNYVAAYKLMLK
ncbi:MAG: ATP/GTP-binding protein [Gammaproteobacteria bacterium]|nr:ATP/GTP-binding protein [Gammaproteobacteria bacterium]